MERRRYTKIEFELKFTHISFLKEWIRQSKDSNETLNRLQFWNAFRMLQIRWHHSVKHFEIECNCVNHTIARTQQWYSVQYPNSRFQILGILDNPIHYFKFNCPHCVFHFLDFIFNGFTIRANPQNLESGILYRIPFQNTFHTYKHTIYIHKLASLTNESD